MTTDSTSANAPFGGSLEEIAPREWGLVRAMLEVCSEPAVVIDRNYTVLWQNAASIEVFGDQAGRPCHAVYCHRDTPCETCVHPDIFEDGKARDTDFPVTDGHNSLVSVRAIPLRNASGAVVAIAEIAAKHGPEELLRESGELFRTLVETMNDGLGIQNSDGTLQYVNKRFATMLGYSPNEVVGHPTTDFVAPEDREVFEEHVRERKSGAFPVPYELTWLHRNGQRLHTRMAPQAVMDQRTGFEGSFAVVTDITTHKLADHALMQSEALYRGIIENANDIFYRRNLGTGVMEYISPSVKAILGYSPMEVIDAGPNCIDLITHPEDQPRLERHFERMLSGEYAQGIAPAIEYRLRDRSGAYHWVSDCSAIVWNAQGEPVAEVGAVRDITERKQAEEALRESEGRFRAILENSRDIAYKLDLSTRTYEYISPSVERITGYPPEEIIDPEFGEVLDVVHPEDQALFRAHFSRLTDLDADEPESSTVEYRLKAKNGVYLWMSDSTTVVRDDAGKPIAIVGVARDISESRQAEEAFLAASRLEATATLAGGIAHEFNNLMVSVLGNAELLEHYYEGDANAKRLLREIALSAQKAGNLTQHLLAYARGGKNEPTLLNLNDRVHQMLLLEKQAFPAGISLEEHPEKALWPVEADARQMDQVIMTLTINAVEAIDDQGIVSVTTENRDLAHPDTSQSPVLPAGRYVCLRVQDTGRGMPEDIAQQIFEPFFTTKTQGRGLGLAATYGIVKNHGGFIRMSSEPGHGTTFEVFLPAAQKKAGLSPAELPRGTETILLVDDEEMVLTVTQKLLERLGYQVLPAADGHRAIAAAEATSETIDVVLLDINMPGQECAKTLEQLLACRPGIRVIVCSGYELNENTQLLLDAGAHGYLHKPFKVADLSKEIRRVIAL